MTGWKETDYQKSVYSSRQKLINQFQTSKTVSIKNL